MPYQIGIGPNLRKSPYFDATIADGVVSMTVYNHMLTPVHFGDPVGEYRNLLENVVMWDVSVERQVQVEGPEALELVRYLTTREIGDIKVGQGKYVPICDYDGMLINDPVLLRVAEDRYWLSLADSDMLFFAAAIGKERGLDVRVTEPDVSPLGVQGPRADDVVASLFGDWVRELKFFWFRDTDLDGIPVLLARSGWSKQGGFELYLRDGSRGIELWNRVKEAGKPFGIVPSAPSDIERIESGLLSYGADARYAVNPFEAGLGAFVQLDRGDDFVGKAALRRIKAEGIRRRRTGFVIEGDRIDGVENWHHVDLDGNTVGVITEAVYSPRVDANIAVGMLATAIGGDADGLVTDLGDGKRTVTVAALPFC